MRPEPRPDPNPGTPEPCNAAIIARAGDAEEGAIASAATPDWAIAPTPIPPDTTDAELVALWLHGKSPHTIRAYGDDVAAFRRFIGKPLRATYLSDLQRYADSLVGAPATRGRRLKTLKSLLSFATRMASTPGPRSAGQRSSRSSPSGFSANAKFSRCSRRSMIGRATTL